MVEPTPADRSDRPVVTAGIAADDLTGANDSAVQFARTGWSTRLVLGDLTGPQEGGAAGSEREPSGPGRSVSVVTDARAMTTEDARAATASAVSSLRSAGVDHLYLKIDSTMRGSILGQVQGALQEWSRSHTGAWAVVCPAYPPMGRTVEDGVLYVGGVPVAETVIGTDPVTPVRTSTMADLLPGSGHVSGDLTRQGAARLAERIREAMGDGPEGGSDRDAGGGADRMVVVDARTEQDLEVLAEAVTMVGPQVVPVGSAGLAIALAQTWGRTDDAAAPEQVPDAEGGTVLVVVSSLNAVSREQADALVAGTAPQDIAVLAPGITDLAGPSSEPIAWLEGVLPDGDRLPRVVMLHSPLERGTDQRAAVQVVDSLARVAQVLLDRDRIGAVVLVGGDGAGAVLDRVGASAIKVAGTVQEGIPIGRIEGGTAEGLTVVTKAGGFGPPGALVEVVDALTAS